MPNIGAILSLETQAAGLATGSSIERIIGTKTSGPTGIEAIIEYNGLYMNNRDWIDTIIIDHIDGLDDADVVDSRTQNPNDDGEIPGKSQYSGRTLVLQGHIVAKTIWKLRDIAQGLREAFTDLNVELPLIFHNVDYRYSLQIFCKKSQKIQMSDEQTTPNECTRDFQIYLRASNPRFLNINEVYASKLFDTVTFDDIAFVLSNNGNYRAQPVFTFTGPFDTLTLINESTAQMLNLTKPIPAGEQWILEQNNYKKRFYRKSDNANKFATISDDSALPVIQKKLNNIRVTATGLTAASLVEVRYSHTVM